MARLTPITSKEQVSANDHAIVDAIVDSRGSLQGPFSMFLHSPEVAGLWTLATTRWPLWQSTGRSQTFWP
jgi:hypothetical protein